MRHCTLQFDGDSSYHVIFLSGENTKVRITNDGLKVKKGKLSVRKKLVSWCIEELNRTLGIPLDKNEEKHIRKTLRDLVLG